MTERVLITGASGFLGYHLIHAAINKGLNVYAAVRRNSNIDHLKDLPLQYLHLNYEDEDDIARHGRERHGLVGGELATSEHDRGGHLGGGL